MGICFVIPKTVKLGQTFSSGSAALMEGMLPLMSVGCAVDDGAS